MNDSKTPLRFGLVGCGRIAQSHVEALGALDQAELVAIAEPREAAGRAAAEGAQASWFAEATDPALAEMVDAVVICSPPSTHHGIVRHFLEHDKHVLCEKPLTLRAADAEQLARLAAERSRQLMMASKFRYVDDVIKAKAIIEAGILGEVIQFENVFTGKVLMKDRWNADPAISGGGVLIDNGSHSVDIARYLLGPVVSVQAQPGAQGQGLSVEDTVHVMLRTQSGVIGNIDLSWTIHKETPWYISVFGREGSLHIGWQGSQYRQDGSSRWIRFGTGYDKVAAFQNQLQNFIDAVRGRAAPLIRPEDALASVQVIEAAYRSMTADKWQPVGTAA
jgi:predicted dehydrogenase